MLIRRLLDNNAEAFISTDNDRYDSCGHVMVREQVHP